MEKIAEFKEIDGLKIRLLHMVSYPGFGKSLTTMPGFVKMKIG